MFKYLVISLFLLGGLQATAKDAIDLSKDTIECKVAQATYLIDFKSSTAVVTNTGTPSGKKGGHGSLWGSLGSTINSFDFLTPRTDEIEDYAVFEDKKIMTVLVLKGNAGPQQIAEDEFYINMETGSAYGNLFGARKSATPKSAQAWAIGSAQCVSK